jgi:hypothetical protein
MPRLGRAPYETFSASPSENDPNRVKTRIRCLTALWASSDTARDTSDSGSLNDRLR